MAQISPSGDAQATVAGLRLICLGLPEVVEKPFGGHTAPSFRVRDKLFVSLWEDLSVAVVKAAPGVQAVLVGSDPGRFLVPPYVGHKGWVGIRLHAGLDWAEITELIKDSYRLTAPKRLAARLESSTESSPGQP